MIIHVNLRGNSMEMTCYKTRSKNGGVMDYWSNGLLELWIIWEMDYWSNGLLE